MEITHDAGGSETVPLNPAASIQFQDQVTICFIGIFSTSFIIWHIWTKKIAFHMDNRILCLLMYFCRYTFQTCRQFRLVSKQLVDLICLRVQFSPPSTMMVLDTMLYDFFCVGFMCEANLQYWFQKLICYYLPIHKYMKLAWWHVFHI